MLSSAIVLRRRLPRLYYFSSSKRLRARYSDIAGKGDTKNDNSLVDNKKGTFGSATNKNDAKKASYKIAKLSDTQDSFDDSLGDAVKPDYTAHGNSSEKPVLQAKYEVLKQYNFSDAIDSEKAALSLFPDSTEISSLPDISTTIKYLPQLDSEDSSKGGQEKAEKPEFGHFTVFSGYLRMPTHLNSFEGDLPSIKEYEATIPAKVADDLICGFSKGEAFSLNHRDNVFRRNLRSSKGLRLSESFKAESKLFVQASIWNRSQLKKLGKIREKGKRNHLILEAPSTAYWRDLNEWVYTLVQGSPYKSRVIHIDAFLIAKLARLHFVSNSIYSDFVASELARLCFRLQNLRPGQEQEEENERDFNDEEDSLTISSVKPFIQPIEILHQILAGFMPENKANKGTSNSDANFPCYEYRVDLARALRESIRTILLSIIEYPQDCVQYFYPQSALTHHQDSSLFIHIPFIEKFIEGNGAGKILIETLQSILAERRLRGEQNLIIGTIPSETSEYKHVDTDEGFRIISTSETIPVTGNARVLSDYESKLLISIENLKNVERLLHEKLELDSMVEITGKLLEADEMLRVPNLSLYSWDEDFTDRVATALAGKWSKRQNLLAKDLEEVLNIVNRNMSSVVTEKGSYTPAVEKQATPKFTSSSLDCNSYEERLLARILDPESIKITYNSVRLPISTIETLQTLVSLPLKHPDAFNYGILADNSVSGVLVFGPPGTGKTMLAKAVAKESGANMLEIKPSDLLHKYVGESEKLVRAVFSLSRKIAPCVVFFDEIDSLLNHRSSGDTSYRRDLINEFMMNWDGLSSENKGVIVMGSTNRPFDLDEAVIRRLPFRILVDLPDEADRLAILKTHLANEKLASNVSVEQLAQETDLYSGSDLKNICVNAALMSTQAIHDDLVKSGASLDTKLGIRTLSRENFEKALKQIGPSISSEMTSLKELRKWDEKYGSHRKRVSRSLGFKGSEKESTESVRVRAT